ncbi:MAG: hypothetical protein JNM72_27695 [Deltaproteobacteria bacterium]|jgi:hypothetical protein|nr:hypothetical protein [Deltaproteobacteria bacterium]
MTLDPGAAPAAAPSRAEAAPSLGAGLDERCEEVRAHLVAARGGAPFLSGADGRLVVRWVEGGVPVPAILSAIDLAVERRRRRPVRGRLSLSACAKELDAWAPTRAAGPGPAVVTAAPPAAGGLGALIDELDAQPLDPPFDLPHANLITELRAAAGLGGIEAVATAAARAMRSFHEACWAALGAGQAALVAEAQAQLEPLREAMGAATFDELVQAEAKDRLRARFPTRSARAVWERLAPGGAA